MPAEVNHAQMRLQLIDGAIQTVARHGFDGTTTKRIAQNSNLNEAYIYRYYFDRNDLLLKAFLSTDRNFFNFVSDAYSKALSEEHASEYERFMTCCSRIWEYAVSDLNYCRYFVRYYASEYFTEEVREEHKRNVSGIAEKMKSLFREGIDYKQVLRHIFLISVGTVMLVAQNIAEDNENLRNQLFDSVYVLLKQNTVMFD